jgi:hypothetical protein
MDVLALAIYMCELAIMAIILYYVVPMIAMPPNMQRVVQVLIILVAIFAILHAVIGSPPVGAGYRSLSVPNIIVPERR